MAAVVLGVEATIDAVPMSQSIGSLLAFITPDELTQRCADLGMSLNDVFDLVGGEVISNPATGASVLHGFELKPSNGYEELCAAIALERDAEIIRLAHGWPILSVRCGNLTVTEAGGANNAPGGGVA